MKTKIEIQQFPSGHYAIVRTRKIWCWPLLVEYLDITASSNLSVRWKRAGGEYTEGCFHLDFKRIQNAYTGSGYAPGIPIRGLQLFSVEDLVSMNEMAVKDEGLADLMLKAKEFYLLKRK